MNWVREENDKIIIDVYVVPNAKKSEIIGEFNKALKMKISSPPVEGAANKEILKFLSKILQLNKSKIEIINGEKSKKKKIALKGIDKIQVIKALGG